MRIALPRPSLGLFVLLLSICGAGQALATVSASPVTSSSQLLGGAQADGQIGDLILANDHIVVIISALGHVTYSGENGGTEVR